MILKKNGWMIVYDKAIREDGSLLFPKRLTREFLDEQRQMLGTYIFANQYLNEIIPDGSQDFKKEWLTYFTESPQRTHTFAFIDPAISLEESADFTALVVVKVDTEGYWWVESAKRFKITATQTVQLIFQVNETFKPMAIGVEVVAYQEALLHFLDEEMRRRGVVIPVTGIKRGDQTKEMRIRSLVPRFEWGRIRVRSGLVDFEDEYSKFPRGAHDDILDALSSIEQVAFKPQKERIEDHEPPPNSPRYESWYIRQLAKKKGAAL